MNYNKGINLTGVVKSLRLAARNLGREGEVGVYKKHILYGLSDLIQVQDTVRNTIADKPIYH